jgi:hypothetical protein
MKSCRLCCCALGALAALSWGPSPFSTAFSPSNVVGGRGLPGLATRSGINRGDVCFRSSRERVHLIRPISGAKGLGSEQKTKLQQLREYGLSGVLAYGMLNCLYYSISFSIAWKSGVVAGSGSSSAGLKASLGRGLTVLAAVWAGSQVTKIFRLGGALLLAPFADRILTKFERQVGSLSRAQAFAVLSSALLFLSLLVLGGQVVMSGIAAPATVSSLALLCPLAFRSKLDAPAVFSASSSEVGIPENPNIHGWKQHPSFLHGYWNVTTLETHEVAGSSFRGVEYVVLKSDGRLKAGPKDQIGKIRGWCFTPANRRILFEVDSVAEGEERPVTLRYSLKVRRLLNRGRGGRRRLTYRFASADGNVRRRKQDESSLPPTPSDRRKWPRIADVRMERVSLARPPGEGDPGTQLEEESD